MFLNELKLAKELGRLISVFDDIENTNEFSVGFISNFNNDYYILRSITPHGRYDGFLLRKTKNILKLSTDGPYEEKIKILSERNNTHHKNCDFGNNDLVEAILTYALQNQLVVAIELLNSGCDDCTGFISSLDDEQCTIWKLNQYGKQNGTAIIEMNDITKINVDSEDEQDLKILYDTTNNK